MTSHLMQIPFEIRQRILKLLLMVDYEIETCTYEGQFFMAAEDNTYCRTLKSSQLGPVGQILRVNKQLHKEGRWILHEENVFRVQFLECEPSNCIRYLNAPDFRNVVVELSYYWFQQQVAELPMLFNFDCLESLSLEEDDYLWDDEMSGNNPDTLHLADFIYAYQSVALMLPYLYWVQRSSCAHEPTASGNLRVYLPFLHASTRPLTSRTLMRLKNREDGSLHLKSREPSSAYAPQIWDFLRVIEFDVKNDLARNIFNLRCDPVSQQLVEAQAANDDPMPIGNDFEFG